MTVLDRPARGELPLGRPVVRGGRSKHPLWPSVVQVAVALTGAGTAALVSLHGSPGHRAARALVVVALTGAALFAEGRSRRWWPGIRSVVIGFFGSVIGGLGGTHLVKGGDSVVTVAGLVVLVSGLVLLVGGGATLIRRTHGWWKLLAVPIAYVALEFGMIPIAMGVYGTNVPHLALGTRTPANYGLAYETVALRATDGVALSGWYVPSDNGAAVVVLAGSGSNRDAVLAQGSVLAERGYGVLFLDNRGHGGSGGYANDFGWYGDQDIGGAVDWLDARSDVSGGRVAVLGESMGGEEAIGAIGADTRIRAVVAEGVTGRVTADRAFLPHDVSGYMMRAEAWVTYTTAGLLSGADAPPSLSASLRAAAPRPILLITGRDELRAGRYYRSASPTNVQLLEFPDTPHTAGLRTHPTIWTQRVVTFLDSALGVTS